MRYSTILLFLLPFNSTTAQQLNWSAERSIGVVDNEALRPRIDVGSNGPVLIWGDSPNDLLFSNDPGTGFIAPVTVQPQGVQPWATSWAGGDIAAHGDTLIAVYSTGTQGVGTLYASRSIDGGSTWPDTVRIAPQPGLEARFPTVAYIPGQGPVVEYMEFDPNWSEPRYVVSSSFDGGTTYGPPMPVSAPFAPGEVCDCCTGQMVAGENQAVALYRNNDSNVRTMWAASSADGGATFPVGGEIDETGWVYGACSSSGPDGYIAGDSLRYVWMSGATNGTKIYYGSALLSDLSVGANALVHGDQLGGLQQNFPRIAGSGDTLGIVWQQNRLGDLNILFSWSVNGWAGLSAPDTIHTVITGAQRTPDVAYENGVFHLVWEEQATGTLGYRSATINAFTGIANAETESLILLWPNPASDELRLNLPTDARGVMVIDGMGHVVLRSHSTQTLNISALPAGSYALQYTNSTGQQFGHGRFVKK